MNVLNKTGFLFSIELPLRDAVYSYSSGMVVSSFTRMVSEAQCCGRLHHRDSHSFPLLLSGAIAKVTRLLRPGMLGIHILFKWSFNCAWSPL